MRLVAIAAVDPLVQTTVVGGLVVARRAVASSIGRVSRARVWVVAAGASPGLPVFGVVRRHVRVATRAGRRRGALHVVRVVTIGALGVRLHAVSAEHQHVFVAVATGDRLTLLEVVRSVTAGALRVSLEQGCFRNARVLSQVARRAGLARVLCGCVLVCVTGAAGGDDVFTGRGVCRGDLVAFVAGRRRRSLLLVRSMARKALLGMVHAHRRHVTLRHEMAACAIARCERL